MPFTTFTKRLPLFLICGALGIAATLAPLGCSDTPDATTGTRLALAIRVGTEEGTAAITNQKGWTIVLSKAHVATGAFYFFEGSPIFSWAPPSVRGGGKVHQLFGDGIAHAHPGHYVAGEARGQMLAPTSIDLLKADTTYPNAEGTSGITRSATFSFSSPATGPFANDLGASVVVLEGTATKAGASRIFRAEVGTADVLHDGQLIVEGCPFEEANVQSNGTVFVKIRLSTWLGQVEFDEVKPSTDGKPVLLDPSSTAFNQLVRGVKVGAAYTFSYKAVSQ